MCRDGRFWTDRASTPRRETPRPDGLGTAARSMTPCSRMDVAAPDLACPEAWKQDGCHRRRRRSRAGGPLFTRQWTADDRSDWDAIGRLLNGSRSTPIRAPPWHRWMPRRDQ
jgi:hypothetical protein